MENNEITKISVSKKHTHSKIAAPVKKKPITHTKREKKQNKKIANANENKEKKDAL